MINISHVAGYEYEETILDGHVGESIYVHPTINKGGDLTCTLIAGVSTGKFQITTSSKKKIENDTATWHDWALGENSGTVMDGINTPITGLRGVSVSGDITIEVVI